MKNLILLRHAKSELPVPGKSDFERRLKKRGIEDIRRIAEAFCEKNISIQLVLCSTSARTRETFECFHSACNLTCEVQYNDKLYHAQASEILECIDDVQDQYANLLVIGHNMGISYLASLLAGDPVPEMPTSGLIHLGFKDRIEAHKGKIKLIMFPKEN